MNKTTIKHFIKIAICAIIFFIVSYGLILSITQSLTNAFYTNLITDIFIKITEIVFSLAVAYFLFLYTFKKPSKKINTICGSIIGIIFIVGFIFSGKYGVSEWDMPMIIDTTLVEEYIPFDDENKLVKLNEDSTLYFSDDLPRLDGVGDLFPVYAAFVESVYPKEVSTFTDKPEWLEYTDSDFRRMGYSDIHMPYLRCTGNDKAYERLINKEADIIFARFPTSNELTMANDAGVSLKITPIGSEAFVFIVNSKNRVDDLTMEEIEKIYTGEITNWKDVGGDYKHIRAFQGVENSRSQTTFKILMNGKKLIKPIEDETVDENGKTIRFSSFYKNYFNAIGYCYRFFTNDLIKEGKVKILSIDSIMPTKENIKEGKYKYSTNIYAISLENNQNPNVESLLDWIVGEQGQYIIEESGYVEL